MGELSRTGKTARTPGQGRTDKQPQEKPPGSLGAPAAPPAPGFFHTARHSSPLSLSGRIAPTPFPALRVFCRMGRNSHSRAVAAVPLARGSKKCAIWGLHAFHEDARVGSPRGEAENRGLRPTPISAAAPSPAFLAREPACAGRVREFPTARQRGLLSLSGRIGPPSLPTPAFFCKAGRKLRFLWGWTGAPPLPLPARREPPPLPGN